MKLAIVVTEFPKITETFTMRDAMELRRLGADVRIYYLTKFRSNEVIHEFARPLLQVSHGSGYLLDWDVIKASVSALTFTPIRTLGTLARIVSSFWKEPVLLAKSLAILPKCLRFSRELQEWGATHVHASFAGHPATAAWILHRLSGIPYSISCHGHDIFISQAMLPMKFQSAAFVRAISEFNANFLREHLGVAACRNLLVLHCGVDTTKPLNRTVPPDADFQVLYVGSLEPRKGVEVLLRALARLDHKYRWTCRIAGDGHLRASLEALAGSLGLSNRVSFLGNQTAEQVVSLYDSSNLLVVPSVRGSGGRAEGIPTVIMEALNHACPVIASRLTGIPELVRDHDTGLLFEPGDDEELASCMKLAMDDPDKASAMAMRGKDLVGSEFSTGKNVQRLFELMSGGPNIEPENVS